MKTLLTVYALLLSLGCAKNKTGNTNTPHVPPQDAPIENPANSDESHEGSEKNNPPMAPTESGAQPEPEPEPTPITPTANPSGSWTTSCGLSNDGTAMKEIWTFDQGRLSFRYRVWFSSNTCSGFADSVGQDSQIDTYTTSKLGDNLFAFDLTQSGTTVYIAFKFDGNRMLITKACTEMHVKRGLCSSLIGTTAETRALDFSNSTILTQVK